MTIVRKFSYLIILSLSMVSIQATDPTRPDMIQQTPKAKRVVTQLKLTMIQMSDTQSRAVINGQAMQVGDVIGGYQVTKIGSDYVILTNNKGQVRLRLITSGTLKKS